MSVSYGTNNLQLPSFTLLNAVLKKIGHSKKVSQSNLFSKNGTTYPGLVTRIFTSPRILALAIQHWIKLGTFYVESGVTNISFDLGDA